MRYRREDGCRAWLTCAAWRPEALARILAQYGCAEAVYDRFTREGGAFLGDVANAQQLQWLEEKASPEAIHEMLVVMRRENMGILSMEDFGYPDALRDIPDPPPLLFYRGNLDCLLGPCITVIGSRSPSPSGMEAAERIARELSEAGVRVISGLALGIDGAAHRGCLAGGSPTVAVLGCGLDVNYPAGHRGLKNEILAKGGALLSEYPPGSPAMQWHFPVRNRIMSGLSRAVVLVEARIRSGSMSTVHHALDQGREVYAYPGVVGTEWAEGAHQLLREGANYFASAQDILEDLNLQGQRRQPPAPERQAALPPLNDDQRIVYARLCQGGEQSFDELVQATGLEPSALSGALTMLQILGIIRALPGKAYVRT